MNIWLYRVKKAFDTELKAYNKNILEKENTMYSPFYYGNGITPKEDLKSGYPNKESLMQLKGFKDWQHFIVHYVVYVNKDEKGNLFYNCEKR